jgi:LmbE family N-acetylglucosaminyl deacetylase
VTILKEEYVPVSCINSVFQQIARTRGGTVPLPGSGDTWCRFEELDRGLDLRSIRAQETTTAMDRLGWSAPTVTRLGLPDGGVSRCLESLTVTLSALLYPDDLCLAPWWYDGHPDHDACGRAALAAAATIGASLQGYLVWAWHWGRPNRSELPWEHCRRLDFSRRQAARKRWATAVFVSQTKPLGPDHERAALLPSPLLRRF